MKQAYEKYDAEAYREEAFNIMAYSSFICAGKYYHVASKIHGAYMRKEVVESFQYYCSLVEEAIALRIKIHTELCKKKGTLIKRGIAHH